MIDDHAPITESDFLNVVNDLNEAVHAHDVGLLRALGTCFPACVYKYDRSTHTAEVMPLVKQGFYNGKWEYIRRKPLKVSVRNIQCGGFTIDIPVYIGDTGWVFSSDRDTSLIKQTGALTNSVLEKDRPIAIVEDDYQQKPNTLMLHSFVHGFFIPDNWGRWESHRYKDRQGVSVGTSLYIGSSIDTNDNRTDVDEKHFQKGDGYEQKASTSIVFNKKGGVTIASSSDTETNQNAFVAVEENSVGLEANDGKSNFSSAIKLNSDDGILIRQDTEGTGQHFLCSIKSGRFLLRMMDGENMLSFSFENGKLNVATSNDVNMRVGGDTLFRCAGGVHITGEKDMNVHAEGNVNVRAVKNAYVAATNARIVSKENASVAARNVSMAAAETANVNAGQTVNIGSTKNTNINSAQKVNLAAGKEINVTAPDAVNIVTAQNVSVMAKKKAAKVLVTTLSKDSTIDVVAEGKNSQMNVIFQEKESAVNLTMKNERSSVNVVTEKGQSPISVQTNGENSQVAITTNNTKSKIAITTKGTDANINLSAEKSKVSIDAKESIDVHSQKDINIEADKTLSIKTGEKVKIESKKVHINGELRVNSYVVKPEQFKNGKDTIKYWSYDESEIAYREGNK